MEESSVFSRDLTGVVRSLLGQICQKKDVDSLVKWLEECQTVNPGNIRTNTDVRRQNAEQLRILLGCARVRFISRQALKEREIEPQLLVKKSFRAMCGTMKLTGLEEATKSRIRAAGIHLGLLRKRGLDQDDIDIIVDFIIASSTGDAFALAVLEASMPLLPEARPLGLLASGGLITGISRNDCCLGVLV